MSLAIDFLRDLFMFPPLVKKELETITKSYGIKAVVRKGIPAGSKEVKPSRIALYDYYGGSMPSGWVRWMMEQYHFDYQQIFPQEIDGGDLNEKYDVILFIGPGIPGASGGYGSGSQPKKRGDSC
ncbi:hypothetical protein [Algoriphagus boritolerans]|uniref:hypothetical protein n=1 Tax=Algoriphagus boritolerans TaxID=308111 RepID=UPI000B300763